MLVSFNYSYNMTYKIYLPSLHFITVLIFIQLYICINPLKLKSFKFNLTSYEYFLKTSPSKICKKKFKIGSTINLLYGSLNLEFIIFLDKNSRKIPRLALLNYF